MAEDIKKELNEEEIEVVEDIDEEVEVEEVEVEDDGDFEIVDEDEEFTSVNEDEEFEELEELEDVEDDEGALDVDLGPQTVDILPEIDDVMESIEDLDIKQEEEEREVESARLILEPMDEEIEPMAADNFKKDEVQFKPIDFDALKQEIKDEIHMENNKKLAKVLLVLTPLLAVVGIATTWAFTAVAIYLAYVYNKLEKDPILLYYTVGVMGAIVLLKMTTLAYTIGRIVGS